MIRPRGPRLVLPKEEESPPAWPAATLPNLFPPPPPERQPCSNFAEWWFDLKCSAESCRHSCGYPVKLLLKRRYVREDSRVGDVAPRFRCKTCGCHPQRVLLVERIDRMPGTMHGGGPNSGVIDLSNRLPPPPLPGSAYK